MHILHSLAVFRASGDYVNACGIDAAVTENISKFGDVLLNAVEYPCKQVTEVVREYFVGIHICILTQIFHISPDVSSAQRLACACDKNTA